MTLSHPPCKPIRISAPGKVILHGEHSVVYNKLAVAASLGLRSRLEYTEEVERAGVSIEFASLNLVFFYSLQDIQALVATPLPLTTSASTYSHAHPELLDHDKILVAVTSFMQEKPGFSSLNPQQQSALTSFLYLMWAFWAPVEHPVASFKLTVTSQLTVGAGTGSSASFAVILAAFWMQYLRVKQHKSNLRTFDKNELELISKWAFQSERIIHGTPSGVDNTVCTYGGLVEFRKGAAPKVVELSTRFSAILVNSGVPRDTKRLVANVAERREKYKLIIERILDGMDILTNEALANMKKITNDTGDDLYENLGELADINHHLLGCLGVSHPKLEEIHMVFTQHGLHGKLTGAGGGGYAICLIPPTFDKRAVKKVVDELSMKGFEAAVTDLGGCGVTIDS